MKFRLVSMRMLLIFCISFWVACTNDPRGSCSGVPDNVQVIDTLEHSGRIFRLVHRVAGYHDKEDILELYTEKLSFNGCGKLRQDPVFGAFLYLEDQHVNRVVLNTHEQSLDIVYAEGNKPLTHLFDLTLAKP